MGEPRYTEKEMVMAQRGAFIAGSYGWLGSPESMKKAAVELYPLPKVERPRVVTDAEGEKWRWTNEEGLQIYDAPGEWVTADSGVITETCRETIADLLAHPSEFVDDEG